MKPTSEKFKCRAIRGVRRTLESKSWFIKIDQVTSFTLSQAHELALLRLLHDESGSRMTNRNPFPGAIGRPGTFLAKRGLVTRIGRTIYANNRPEMGERPDAYVQFDLTDFGRRVAKQIEKAALRKLADNETLAKAGL